MPPDASAPASLRVPTEPLRVLHLCWRLGRQGGIAVVIRSLAGGLDPADGVVVEVVTVRPRLAEDELDAVAGIERVHTLDYTGPMHPVAAARLAVRFARLTRRSRPHIIHAHSGTAVVTVLAALANPAARRVLDVHDAPGNGRHSPRTEAVEGWLCRRLAYVPVVHSTSVRQEIAGAWRVPPAAARLVPLGVDTAALAGATVGRARWREELGVGPGEIVVLYVARLVPSKRVDLLIEAADRLRQRGDHIRVVVVAEGSERSRLQAMIDRLGLGPTVGLVGSRGGTDLLKAFGGADVYCSTSDYEGFGLGVAEAMAAGLPVVATAVGGVTDLVVDGTTGTLVAPGDATAVADGISALLHDADRRRRYGDAGRARARERFDRSQTAGRYLAVYRELTAADRRRAGAVPVAVLKSGPFGPAGGTAPLPYRIDLLRPSGFSLTWTDRHLGRAAALVGRGGPGGRAPMVQTVLALPRLARSPVALAMFESEGHALALLRAVPGPWRRPALAIVVCWLAEQLEQAAAAGAGMGRYRRAYRHVDRLIYFSRNQTAIFEERLGVDPSRLRPVPFGIDHERFVPSRAPGAFVLAAGRDRGRDWPTFLAAAARAGLPTKVVCRRADLEGLRVPANVEVLGPVSADEYRALLGLARVCVVASRPLAYPTGQSVFLESLATGRATVVTTTLAMADYIDDGVTCRAVPPADAGALALAMGELYEDGALRARLGSGGRDAVEDRYNARTMWDAIAGILHEL